MINDLYKKVAQFESELGNSIKALSQCKNGCSKCCYTDISVFEVEASNIRSWFSSLSSEQQLAIKEKWNLPQTEGSCAFLRNESCTIYEARPLICRTQGNALRYVEENEPYIDICPLNEEMIEEMEDKDVMNLDLMNTIVSKIEQEDSKNTSRMRVSLKDLQAHLR